MTTDSKEVARTDSAKPDVYEKEAARVLGLNLSAVRGAVALAHVDVARFKELVDRAYVQRSETALASATTPTTVTVDDRNRAARWLDGADAAGLIGHWRIDKTRASLAELLAEVRREERERCAQVAESLNAHSVDGRQMREDIAYHIRGHRRGEPSPDAPIDVDVEGHLQALETGKGELWPRPRTIMVGGYAPAGVEPNNRAVELEPRPAEAPHQCMVTRDVFDHAFVRGVRCTRDAGHPDPGQGCYFEHAEARAREALQRRESASSCCPTEELSHFEGCKLFTELRRLRRIEEAASALSDRMRDHWVGGRGGENYWDAPHTAVVALRNALGARPAKAVSQEGATDK